MPFKDKERKKEYQKAYQKRPENIAKAKARVKAYSEIPENKVKTKEYMKEWYSRPENKAKIKENRNKPKNKEKQKERDFVLKLEVFSHYSKKQTNADFPVCACCLYDDIRALSIDHIIPFSKLSASEKLLPRIGSLLWRYLKQNNYPKKYQVLCHNCNHMKATKVECPHQLDKVRTYCKIVELKK